MKAALLLVGLLFILAGMAVTFTGTPAVFEPCSPGGTPYLAKVVGQVQANGVGLVGATVRVYWATELLASGTTDTSGNYAVTVTITHYGVWHTVQASKANYNPASLTFLSACGSANPTVPQVYAMLTLGLTGLPVLTSSFSYATTDLTSQFTDTSTGGATSWTWAFGDGTSSTAQSPSHTYPMAGTYAVKLTATRSSDGAQSAVTQSVTLTAQTQSSGTSTEGTPTTDSGVTPTPPTPPVPPEGEFQLGLLSIVLFAFGAIILILAVAWRGGA